jgi:hypothetical protein
MERLDQGHLHPKLEVPGLTTATYEPATVLFFLKALLLRFLRVFNLA